MCSKLCVLEQWNLVSPQRLMVNFAFGTGKVSSRVFASLQCPWIEFKLWNHRFYVDPYHICTWEYNTLLATTLFAGWRGVFHTGSPQKYTILHEIIRLRISCRFILFLGRGILCPCILCPLSTLVYPLYLFLFFFSFLGRGRRIAYHLNVYMDLCILLRAQVLHIFHLTCCTILSMWVHRWFVCVFFFNCIKEIKNKEVNKN